MRILVSNDDGYFSPGIAALAQAMSAFGQVVVVAPEADRSGASNSLTLDRPLYVRRSSNGFHYVNGTPTDCVHVAVTGFLGYRPDLVVSGINNSANLAEDTLYAELIEGVVEAYPQHVAVHPPAVERGGVHTDALGCEARIDDAAEQPPVAVRTGNAMVGNAVEHRPRRLRDLIRVKEKIYVDQVVSSHTEPDQTRSLLLAVLSTHKSPARNVTPPTP